MNLIFFDLTPTLQKKKDCILHAYTVYINIIELLYNS